MAEAMMGRMVHLPDGHPAHVFDVDLNDDSDDRARLDVFVTGGRREYDTKTLRHWTARAEVTHDDDDTPNVRVAAMRAMIVQAYLGHPWDDLDHIDDDAEALGAVFFDGQQRSDAFMDIAEGYGEPVLLISNYTVEPDWRGTPYSAFIAARMLSIFADMGVTAAALQASPAGFDGADDERRRIRGSLRTFWGQFGFTSLAGEPDFMAAALDPGHCMDLVSTMARDHDLPFTARDR